MKKLILITLSLGLAQLAHGAETTYRCIAQKHCPAGAQCLEYSFDVTMNNQGQLKSVVDSSHFTRLEISETSMNDTLLSIQGREYDGLFFAQIDLSRLSFRRPAGLLITSYGHDYRLKCEVLK